MSQEKITPKTPDQTWLESYFYPTLLEAKAYKIDTPVVDVKLDQNESPWDWPQHLKKKILDRVAEKPWNRYPEPIGEELHQRLSDYVGVPANCLLTSPGSNMMIPLVFDAMAKSLSGKVVVARPSFALFEMHCNYAGIPYETWDLDENFEYQLDRLPELPDGSFVVFASPNNPTGTSISPEMLETMLAQNPKTMFLADEAYYEFNDQPYTHLMAKYSNLMILRTMSKTMGAAGVRLGYLMAPAAIIEQVKKLRLPYLLNHFSMEAAKIILSDDEMQAFVKKNIENAVSERDRIYQALSKKAADGGFRVFNSKANFLLLQWLQADACDKAYRHLIEKGILVRNMSKGPGLAGCLRVSIGTQEENDRLIAVF
ncbi:pyridoxal phosphate-dependent aminotransferase [Pseudobacteriovorax antillogorgiicola]|uniref:Histidinol phosphate aminotransferase apoenzyme n=1 Tax=Pseudobacteriovorax antillogorgiicola TaxID=1513793 RepID=A0A1Y6BP51_9BACT|nr:histidinol-phosphate transaminase [Pseudobacteriovorax antillogorgiicola]TCS53806.1 histidinol phosphate aminotransferase [Pseudobacteriovorax antillogorgiicola]SMF22067.1 histidinol phosphate aminotransferase apoenzyme [Pseudobacteriovorax antillogorgiicola]